MKITEEKKKGIIADYLMSHSYAYTAERFSVSPSSVRNYVKADPGFAERYNKKKQEIGDRVVEYLASKEPQLYTFIDVYLDAMLEPEKIASASVNQLSTTFGTVLDKFVNLKAVSNEAANTVCVKIEGSLKELSE